MPSKNFSHPAPSLKHKVLGSLGEKAAANYLRKHGCTIEHTNLRVGRGELDIVYSKNGSWGAVEVKSGSSDPAFSPLLHFTWRKRKQLFRLIQIFNAQRKPEQRIVQLDLMVVTWSSWSPQVSYYPQALFFSEV